MTTNRDDSAIRAAEAINTITAAAEALTSAIAHTHPKSDCLPLPSLTVPEQPELGVRIKSLADNLFEGPGHHRAQSWVDIRTTCKHVDTEALFDIYESLYRWYQLLIAAREHIEERHPLRRLHDLAAAKERFDASTTATATSQLDADSPAGDRTCRRRYVQVEPGASPAHRRESR